MEPHGLIPDLCYSVQQPGHQNVQRVPMPQSDTNVYSSESQGQPIQAPSGGQLVSEDTDPKDSFVWQHESTLLLISLYRVNRHLFMKGSIKKKSVWILISKKMKDIGQHVVSAAQCENKWKSLTAAYRKVADHNSKQGTDHKTCPYFNEISDLYGYRPKLASSCQEASSTMSSHAQCSSADHSSSVGQNSIKKKRNVLLAKRKQAQIQNLMPFSDLVQTLRNYSEQRRKENEAHLSQMRQMHDEKMAVLKGILEVLKSLRK